MDNMLFYKVSFFPTGFNLSPLAHEEAKKMIAVALAGKGRKLRFND